MPVQPEKKKASERPQEACLEDGVAEAAYLHPLRHQGTMPSDAPDAPDARGDARRTLAPPQGKLRDKDLEAFWASQRESEAERVARLQQLQHGPVPKTRFERQQEAEAQRKARDDAEMQETYDALLRDLDSDAARGRSVLGTQFVAKGGTCAS